MVQVVWIVCRRVWCCNCSVVPGVDVLFQQVAGSIYYTSIPNSVLGVVEISHYGGAQVEVQDSVDV